MMPASLIVKRFEAEAGDSLVVGKNKGSATGINASAKRIREYHLVTPARVKRIPVLVDQTQGGGQTPLRYRVTFVKRVDIQIMGDDELIVNARLDGNRQPVGGFKCRLIRPDEQTPKPGATFVVLEVQREP
ncbi:MAG: hypothetical protein J0L53_07200 [Spirochaetes bacterium]|nr:hypothetical protein [Spirochaetota bacterium]